MKTEKNLNQNGLVFHSIDSEGFDSNELKRSFEEDNNQYRTPTENLHQKAINRSGSHEGSSTENRYLIHGG